MERQSLKDLQDSVINSQEEFKKVEHDVIPVFDPRVTFKSKKEQDEAKIIWSSKSIELAYEAIKDGLGLKISPFMRNDTKLRKANLNFQYSEEETLEIIKCKKDILYFAEKYVYLMTPKGKQIIKLRGYQKRLLKLMQDNRWIILLQSRQSAKCLNSNSVITIRHKSNRFSIIYKNIGELYFELLSKTRSLTLREKILRKLYKIYNILNLKITNYEARRDSKNTK